MLEKKGLPKRMHARMLLTRRKMLATSAVMTAAVFSGCIRHSTSVLRIGTSVWPGYEPLFLAQKQNQFDPSIQVVEYPGTREIHRAFSNRAVEAATVTLDEAVMIAQFQPDIRVIMAISFSNGADALLAQPHIPSIADLRGKRIGIEPNSVAVLLLARALEQAELGLGDIQAVPMRAIRAETVFRNGAVDGVILREPATTRVRNHGALTIFDSSQIPGEVVDVLIVRQESLRAQRETLVQLLRGWFRAVEEIESTNNRSVLPGETDGISNPVELLNRSRNNSLFAPSGGELPDTVRKLSATFKKYDLIDQMIDPTVLLDSTILNSIA